MDIIGKLIQVLPEQRGESARGAWVRGGFVIQTEEQFPRKIAFSILGEDRVSAMKNIAINTSVKVVFSIESREYQERWYTECRCTDIEVFTSVMPQTPYIQGSANNQNSGMPSNTTIPTQPNLASPSQDTIEATPTTDTQATYQQPPQAPEQKGGEIEQMDSMENKDDLPF